MTSLQTPGLAPAFLAKPVSVHLTPSSAQPFAMRQAALWIAEHHQRLAALRTQGIVIKVGGSIQDNPDTLRTICRDAAALVSLGLRPVLIHGGGKAITAAMSAAGLAARFVQGQRYTDAPTLTIVEKVLAGQINREILGYLAQHGAKAQGVHTLSGGALFGVRTRAPAKDGQEGEDLGLVGRVTRVNTALIIGLCEAGVIPVIAPVAFDIAAPAKPATDTNPATPPGRLNVNADLAAGTIAAALGAHTFILVSDTPGVRLAADTSAPCAPSMTRADYDLATASGAIAGGMLPKLDACYEALRAGVKRVAIVDGREPGSLLTAALSDPGEPVPGTWVS